MAVVRARSSPPYGTFVGFFLFGVAAVAAVGCYYLYANAANDISSAKNDANSKTTAMQTVSREKSELERQLLEATKKRDDLADQLTRAKIEKSDLQTRADNDRKASEESSKSLAAAKDTFAKETKDLEDKNNKLTADIAKVHADLTAAGVKAQEDQQKAQAAAEDNLRDLRLKLDQANSDIEKGNKEIAALRGRLGDKTGTAKGPETGEPDGTIGRVNQASHEATIPLGKKDHIVAGMTFTAYDPRLGVRYTSDEAALGNGSIEVMEVYETQSLCRITRVTPNRAVQTGDLISNIVYHADRTRQKRFVIRGDFDLDGDGVSTAAEREHLERLITAWGGKIDTTVSSLTDYVVTGDKPRSMASIEEVKPEGATTAPAAAEPGSVADQRAKDQSDYDDVIVQAERLSIPVLNKNRFLAMIGYYNTTIVRYGASQ